MERKNIIELVNSPEKILNLCIEKVFRILDKNELETIPKSKRLEEADGITFILFTNRTVLGLYPDSTNYTLDYQFFKDNYLIQDEHDVTHSLYWRSRINSNIESVECIFSFLKKPYGIKLNLLNGNNVEFHYVSENEYTFDAIIVGNAN